MTGVANHFQIAHALYSVMVGKRLIVRHALWVSLTLLGLLVAWGQVYAQEQETEVPDPCSGPSALLAILDRPTVSTSPCAVPRGQFMLEMGFQRSKPRDPVGGTIDNYPQAEVRIGLPGRNEFTLIPPSYNRQRTSDSTAEAVSGYSALTLGLKHELGYTRQWLGAVQALFTLPSGSSAYGSQDLGVAFNGIVAYALSEQVGLTLQIGISSQTDPELAGGGRFTGSCLQPRCYLATQRATSVLWRDLWAEQHRAGQGRRLQRGWRHPVPDYTLLGGGSGGRRATCRRLRRLQS